MGDLIDRQAPGCVNNILGVSTGIVQDVDSTIPRSFSIGESTIFSPVPNKLHWSHYDYITGGFVFRTYE